MVGGRSCSRLPEATDYFFCLSGEVLCSTLALALASVSSETQGLELRFAKEICSILSGWHSWKDMGAFTGGRRGCYGFRGAFLEQIMLLQQQMCGREHHGRSRSRRCVSLPSARLGGAVARGDEVNGVRSACLLWHVILRTALEHQDLQSRFAHSLRPCRC